MLRYVNVFNSDEPKLIEIDLMFLKSTQHHPNRFGFPPLQILFLWWSTTWRIKFFQHVQSQSCDAFILGNRVVGELVVVCNMTCESIPMLISYPFTLIRQCQHNKKQRLVHHQHQTEYVKHVLFADIGMSCTQIPRFELFWWYRISSGCTHFCVGNTSFSKRVCIILFI